MVDILRVNDLGQLSQFLNDKNIMEIAIRNKNKKFKAFQKVAIDELSNNTKQQKALNSIMDTLNKKYKINVKI